MPAAQVDQELELLSEIGDSVYDPLAFVEECFPWGTGILERSAGPREWQRKILGLLRDRLESDPFSPVQIAVSSGHGIGKSALVAMILSWALSTCEDCKIVVTANTATQLATKTVPRVEEWLRLCHTSHWWDMKATSVTFKDQAHARLWRADYVPWSENNTEAFAGLHNKGKRIVLVFDEASGIADKVWEVAEGAMTDSETEIIWLAFGNPTQNTGRFRECFGKFKHRWSTFQIDSRTVEGTNKEQIDKWIEDYGEDSDFVRVRVKGEFPRAGSTQFISSDDVERCRKFKAQGHEQMPKILSVDVARQGDDQSVIGYRQGRKLVILGKYRGLSTVQTAERTIEFMRREHPDATIVDGDGIGAGVVDQLTSRGFKCFEFHGGATPKDEAMYFNRRAEAWGGLRDMIAKGMEIPDDPELATDLTAPQYGFSNKGQIQLERKEDMKKRGLASPDCGDMAAMTFGIDVLAKRKPVAPYVPASSWS